MTNSSLITLLCSKRVPHKPLFSVHNYRTDSCRTLPLVVKESPALVMTFHASKSFIANSQFDDHTEKQLSCKPGLNKGVRIPSLTELSRISAQHFQSTTLQHHSISSPPLVIQLTSCLTPSLTRKCMLSRSPLLKVNWGFCPHTLELMSLYYNAQREVSGNLLNHFMPHLTPPSLAVNVFVRLCHGKAIPVFPPFVFMGPLLKFLATSNYGLIIIIPQHHPLPFWWPVLWAHATAWIQMGSKVDFDMLLFPSSNNLPCSGTYLRFTILWKQNKATLTGRHTC